jgi:iron complex transport system substrate-binding protein
MSAQLSKARARRVAFTLVGAVLLGGGLASALDVPTYLGPKPPAKVRRVVTLAPSLTETVIALGAADRLVGVSRFDEFPEVSTLPRVGGFVDPSVEAVIALKPDLVLVQPSPGNRQPVEKMAELNTPVLVLRMQSVAEILAAIREMGKALELPARAESITASIERSRSAVRARARGEKTLRVLFVYGFDPLVVAGPGSFTTELLSDAGAVNAAQSATAPYQTYSAESAIRSRPDVVIVAADDVSGEEKFAQLPGLKEARWVRLRSKDLLHPGPSLSRGLEELFNLIHPAPRSTTQGAP